MVALQTEMMERDPGNHTKWKHKWRWHNRGNVWDKIAKEWADEEDWMRARDRKNTHTHMVISSNLVRPSWTE